MLLFLICGEIITDGDGLWKVWGREYVTELMRIIQAFYNALENEKAVRKSRGFCRMVDWYPDL